jgi:hypothetical protein
MFDFLKPKRVEVLSHWYTPVPHFSASTPEFYAAIEDELKEQKVPGLEISKVEFSEGGLLSEKRLYLRMTRERLVFDICAAPFGTNYFYSCRFAEVPAVVKLWHVIVLLITLNIVVGLFWRFLGFLNGTLLLCVCIALVAYLLRNAVAMGLHDLDATLIKTPVIGPIYEAWFRKETYYRQDTRLMYLTVVEGVVKKLVEEETAAKGVKLLTQYEYAPILGDLYKPRPFGKAENPEADDLVCPESRSN